MAEGGARRGRRPSGRRRLVLTLLLLSLVLVLCLSCGFTSPVTCVLAEEEEDTRREEREKGVEESKDGGNGGNGGNGGGGLVFSTEVDYDGDDGDGGDGGDGSEKETEEKGEFKALKGLAKNLKRAIEDGKGKLLDFFFLGFLIFFDFQLIFCFAVKVFVQSTQRDRASLEVNAEDMPERDNHFIVSVSDSSSSSEAMKEAKDVDDSSGSGIRVIRMTNSEGILLDCELPNLSEETKKSEEKALEAITDEASAIKYLGEATLRNCHRKTVGWWTYEVCPLSHVKQFHAENSKVLSNFDLGFINTEKTWNLTKASSFGSQKSVSFLYDHGTKCDLNGMPRETVVNFSCSPSFKDAIKQVRETSSCSYVVDFESKELCKWRPDKPINILNIRCNKVTLT